MDYSKYNIHESWHPHIHELFHDKRMKKLLKALYKCYYFPSKNNIFKSLSVPLDDIKLTIVGKHPYSSKESTGIPYEVLHYPKSSLCNILSDIEDTFYNGDFNVERLETDDTKLDHWGKQGIFLINESLTVEKNKPGSHNRMWRWFTNKILNIVSEKNIGSIFAFFGLENKVIHNESHIVYEFPDPSNEDEFKGVFEKLSYIVKKNYKYKIKWDKYESETTGPCF